MPNETLLELTNKSIFLRNGKRVTEGFSDTWISDYGGHIGMGVMRVAPNGVVLGKITIPNSSDFNAFASTLAEFSLEFYFNLLVSVSHYSYFYLLSNSGNSYTTGTFVSLNTTATNLTLGLKGGNNTGSTINYAFTPTIGQWYHFYLSTKPRGAAYPGQIQSAFAINGTSASTLLYTSNSMTPVTNNLVFGQNNVFTISDLRMFNYLKYGFATSVPFTPTPRTESYKQFVPIITIPNTIHTIPYYAPYLRGKPYGQ